MGVVLMPRARQTAPAPELRSPLLTLPSSVLVGVGHPLLAGKLVSPSAVRYPASLSSAPMGKLTDDDGNAYFVRPGGYEFEKLFVDPDAPPHGRNDPVYTAWYNAAVGKARANFWADNEAIYELNRWNNARFCIGQFEDIAALEAWAAENDTTLAELEAQGVTPKKVRQADPGLDRATPNYYTATTPFVLVGGGSAWASQDYEGLALHNPPDDGRDQVAGVRAPLPAATLAFLQQAYHLASGFGQSLNLSTLDGKPPAFLLTVNRWSRLAYIQGTNVVTLPGKQLKVLESIRNAKSGDVVGAVISIGQIFAALGGGQVEGLDKQQGIVMDTILPPTGNPPPAPPAAAAGSGTGGLLLVAALLYILFKAAS